VLVLLVVVNLGFFLGRVPPGSAAMSQVTGAGSHGGSTDVQIVAERFGLDKPLFTQYLIYMRGIFGTFPPNLGTSYMFYPSSVASLFYQRVGWSMLLIIPSIFLSLGWAYALAGLTALRRAGKFELGTLYTAVTVHAIPVYWFSMILLGVFALTLGWFPIFGAAAFNPGSGFEYVFSVLRHAFLPILALSLAVFGHNYLLLRGSVQEVLRMDYVIAAKTRGLKNRVIATGYILRNSMLPIVSILSYNIATVVSLLVLVESVFAYPGIGDLIVDAIGGRDYPTIAGSLFYLTIIVIIGGIIGDVLLQRLDPRLRS
jgi:ABC-type dipeptide/oligopeptide/nickel transport system permease component